MGLLWGVNVALKNGDVVMLYNRDGQQGFLAADTAGAFGSSDEILLLAPTGKTAGGEVVYPSSFQSRCMFRVDSGQTEREDILYGQPIMLVHVTTDMHLTATSKDDVELMAVKTAGSFFVPEPRYKLRSEGEKILSGDHVLIQSRRYPGSYVRLSAPLDDELLSPGRTLRDGGRSKPAVAMAGAPEAAGFFESTVASILSPKRRADESTGAQDLTPAQEVDGDEQGVGEVQQKVKMSNMKVRACEA